MIEKKSLQEFDFQFIAKYFLNIQTAMFTKLIMLTIISSHSKLSNRNGK